jgi:hypothetical protein
MNQCPECHEPVLEMAAKCRHCGSTLDEKTLFLGEQDVVEEIRVARLQHAQKLQRLTRAKQLITLSRALVCASVGVFILVAGLAPPNLKGTGMAVGGALLAAGVAVLLVSRKSR